MLHLSFTQQLCHVAKINQGEAANDAIFGSSKDKRPNGTTVISGARQKESPASTYLTLRQLAQRCLKNRF